MLFLAKNLKYTEIILPKRLIFCVSLHPSAESLSASGGSTPEPPMGLYPQTPVMGSRSRARHASALTGSNYKYHPGISLCASFKVEQNGTELSSCAARTYGKIGCPRGRVVRRASCPEGESTG